MNCSACGFQNPEGFRFCGGCGAPLSAEAPAGDSAEHRQLTVLFCDLVESTRLSEELGPEEFRQLIRDYHDRCAGVVERFGGHVAQYLGDGVLVYFGFPQAEEDSARRAVDAALELVAEMERWSRSGERAAGAGVRIGVHTGAVVAGEVGAGARRERLALGPVPNVAARLQSEAETGQVLLSESTFQLSQGFFECEALGPRPIRGLTEPLRVYRALRPTGVRTRFELAVRKGLAPAVGREKALELLLDRLARVCQGRGQLVLVSGDAGIGKSRLLHLLMERTGAEERIWLASGCSAYHRHSAFHPLIELLEGLLEFGREDPTPRRLARLEESLADLGLPATEHVPLLAPFLGLPLPDAYPPLDLLPHRRKQKTLEALVALLVRLAEKKPVALAIEDLHWIDPSTLEFLHLLAHRVPAARMLVLLTFRPDFQPPWGSPPHLTALDLSPLTAAQVEAMVDDLTGGRRLPPQVLERIVANSDGIPLFVEETVRSMLESGRLRPGDAGYELSGALREPDVPVTLQDSLTARLDRLGPARELVQLAAMLGREFDYRMLRAISPFDEDALVEGLGRAVDADLLRQHGVPPHARYVFKHALIQEVAYRSLLSRSRREAHGRIADTLEREFPELADAKPELLAHHASEAGLTERAVGAWLRAGLRASERSANLEAIEHFRRGIELLSALPEGPARDARELEFQMPLGLAHMATRGYAAEEVERAFARGHELCRRIGETPDLFWALRGLHAFYNMRTDLARGAELGDQLVRLAEASRDPAFLINAHYAMAVTTFFSGEVATAREHVERALAQDPPGRDRVADTVVHTLFDAGVAVRTFAGMLLWHQGLPDRSLAVAREAMALARRIDNPYSLAVAIHESAWLHLYRREPAATAPLVEQMLALCEEQGFVLWAVVGRYLGGWAAAVGAPAAEANAAIDGMIETLAIYRQFGASLAISGWMPVLVELCTQQGRFQDARRVLEDARSHAERHRERLYVPEHWRVEGDLLLAERPGSEEAHDEASACFQHALEQARIQGTRLYELRAACHLARLCEARGRRDRAREVLAPVLGGFTEGFESPDLREARSLLGALA